MARARLAGGYDFLSLLARLMETDVDPLARPAAPDEALRRDHAVKAAHFARSAWSDSYDIGFVRKLPRRSERIVFHERVHYWQQVSTPALQLKFMSYLDKLRYGVSALGGRGEWVCRAVPHAAQDTAQGQADATEEMRVADANAHADWRAGTFDVTRIAGGRSTESTPPRRCRC
jgi:hypothetical protein